MATFFAMASFFATPTTTLTTTPTVRVPLYHYNRTLHDHSDVASKREKETPNMADSGVVGNDDDNNPRSGWKELRSVSVLPMIVFSSSHHIN